MMNKRFNYACLTGGVRFSRRNEARTQRHANGGCIWRLFGTFWEKDGAGVLAANRASGRSAKYIGIPLVFIHASNFPLPPLGSIRGPVGAWMNAGRALYQTSSWISCTFVRLRTIRLSKRKCKIGIILTRCAITNPPCALPAWTKSIAQGRRVDICRLLFNLYIIEVNRYCWEAKDNRSYKTVNGLGHKSPLFINRNLLINFDLEELHDVRWATCWFPAGCIQEALARRVWAKVVRALTAFLRRSPSKSITLSLPNGWGGDDIHLFVALQSASASNG